jgi:multiple sugar transport system substrate-binding protein
MTTRHILWAATSATALTLGTAAIAQDLRVTVWTGNAAHLEMLNGFAESFTADRPGVTVTFETIPAADYTQRLTFQLAGGNAPDLGWIMEDAAPAFIDADVLIDVGPALRADADYDFADLSEPALGLWVDGDAVYGVPFSTSPFMTFFNRDMFEAAGLDDPLTLAERGEWTMDKMRETALALREANPDTWGLEFKDGQGYDSRFMHTMVPAIRAYGGFAWQDNTCGFASPEAVEAMTFLHEMVHQDKSVPPPGEIGDFFSGNAGMTVNQISRASVLATAGFDWGIAPLPSGPAGEAPVIGQAGIGVFAGSANQELATEFLAHWTNQENVATMAQFFPPARQSVLDGDAFVTGNALIPAEQMRHVAAAIADGKVLPSHARAPQIMAAMAPRVDAMWRADADMGRALTAICDAIAPQLR